MKLSSPMDIWKYLPGTNCAICGEKTCLAFASLLKDRKKVVEACTPLFTEEKYAEKSKQLVALLAPEIREIEFGVGATARRMGGEDVMYRHELTFFNRTLLAYDVWDTLDEVTLRERVQRLSSWQKFYVGEFLTIDAIAVRAVSGDPQRFAGCVQQVAAATNLPLVLCSFDPEVLEAGLREVAATNPLLYAATSTNWHAVLELARAYDVPVTLFSPDLDTLMSLARTFSTAGHAKLVLDPGTSPLGAGLAETFRKFIQLRRAGIVEGTKEVAYPLMAVPMTAWLLQDDTGAGLDASYWEAVLATIGIIKYADIMIMHSIEPHALIVERTLAANIYTDPRRPVSVEPGLRTIGTPTADSPLFLTTNFALTYYTVESDLASNKIDSYLLVVDTEGIGVEASVAGGQLTADRIKETMDSSTVETTVTNRTLVLPGLAARLSGELEDATGWTVLVGPRDSGRIPGWLEEHWPPSRSA
jgi:acetyl-CoA decarbonylase/synthase complex subunit gamma